MELQASDFEKLEQIILRRKDEKWALIPLLQEVQETFGYVPPAFIEPIARALDLFPSQVQGVITFMPGSPSNPRASTSCAAAGGPPAT
jgi:NADH:ubiquinone oxidoreductase subunit E